MAKEQDQGSGLKSAPKEQPAPEMISLAAADVQLLQETAAEVQALRVAKAAVDAELAKMRLETTEAIRQHGLELADLGHAIKQERARSAELGRQCEALHGDLASFQAQLATAMLPQKTAAEVEPLKEGHRRVITLQPYRFDTANGVQNRPKGAILQVPERDFKQDQARRFKHLRDHAEHAAEQLTKARRDANPVDHAARNLESVLARVDDVVRLREQARAELERRLASAQHIATQLPD